CRKARAYRCGSGYSALGQNWRGMTPNSDKPIIEPEAEQRLANIAGLKSFHAFPDGYELAKFFASPDLIAKHIGRAAAPDMPYECILHPRNNVIENDVPAGRQLACHVQGRLEDNPAGNVAGDQTPLQIHSYILSH